MGKITSVALFFIHCFQSFLDFIHQNQALDQKMNQARTVAPVRSFHYYQGIDALTNKHYICMGTYTLHNIYELEQYDATRVI